MTIIVHSFVADSRLLDYCDLVVCFLCVFCCCCFSPYRWATVWGFEVVTAVLFLSFGVSCLLA